MAFVPTPLTAKVCLRGRQDGQQVCNVFHVRWPTNPTTADLQEIAAIFANFWATVILPVLSGSYTFEAVEVYDISSQGAEGITFPIPPGATGQVAGTAMPNNVTLAVKLLTGFTGRSRRGRFYLPGIPAGRLDGQNSPDNIIKTAAREFIQDIIERLAEDGALLVVNSLWSQGVQRIEGMTTPITDAQANDVLDSQRRRLPERGS